MWRVGSNHVARYMETDSRFTNYGQFISSSYMFDQLGLASDNIRKRLGDGFYEERAVLDQITNLTGRRFLSDNTDALAQYRALMDSGVAVGRQFDLAVGVALTPAQMAALTQDMVWMVAVAVDGQTVLTPVVYLSPAHARELAANGATLAGRNVTLTTDGDITNNGTITASQNATIKAGNLLNSGDVNAGNNFSVNAAQDILNGGTIHGGGNVSLVAGNDVRSGVNVAQQLGAVNLGNLSAPVSTVALTNLQPGLISAGKDLGISASRDLNLDTAPVAAGSNLSLAAGRDLTTSATAITAGKDAQLLAGRDLSLDATAHTVGHGGLKDGSETTTHTVSTISANGTAVLAAGRDLSSQGAQVKGDTVGVSAGRDLNLASVTDTARTADQTVQGHKVIATHTLYETVRGSTLTGANGVALSAGRDATLIASTASSEKGAVNVAAGRDVNLTATTETHSWEQDTKKSSGGLLSSTTTKTHDSVTDVNAIGSTLSGDTVTVGAGHDLTATAAQIAGTHDVTLAAGNNLTLTTADSTHTEDHDKTIQRSGVMGQGAGIMIGGAKQSRGETLTATTPTGTLVGSTDGRVTLSAGNDVHIHGSDVISQTGTAIVGKNVTIDAALGTTGTTQIQKVSSSGLTVGLAGGVADMALDAANSIHRGSQVKDDRLSALYATKAAYDLKDAASGIQGALNADSAKGASAASGVNLQIGLGASSASSRATTHDEQAYGSHIRSQGDVTVAATGGDLNVIGSDVSGRNVALAAANDLNLRSQAENHTDKSTSTNGSGGVGVSLGSDGLGIYAQASTGGSKTHGNGTTHAESHIDAQNQLSLISGNDTTIQGAQATGNQVLASAGHNFNVISEQDTDDYAGRNHQAGGKFMVGLTQSGLVSGNAYLSQGKVNNHYESVNEASGIQAGSGGYQIHVGDTTHLVGGKLASTADPSKNLLDTGRLVSESLQNISKYSASQTSISGGSTLSSNAWGGVGSALSLATPQKENHSSTTESGIAAGTVNVRNGSAIGDLNRNQTTLDGNGVKDSFDPSKVAEHQELGQVAAQVGMRTVGEIAQYQQKDANDKLNQAKADYQRAQAAGDTTGMQQASQAWDAAKAQYQRWSDGSTNMTIVHGVMGAAVAALGNGNALQGGLGAAAGEAATPVLAGELGRNGAALGAALVGDVVGGGNGAATASAGALYNYLSHDQQALEQKEKDACAGNLVCQVQVEAKWTAISGKQDAGLGVGIVAGIGISGRNALDAIAYLDPSQVMDGLHALLSDPNVRAQIPAQMLQSLQERNDFIDSKMQQAGWSNSVEAGEAMGSLLFDFGSAASAVKGGLALASDLPATVRGVAGAVNDLGALVRGGGQVGVVSDVPVATGIADAEAGATSPIQGAAINDFYNQMAQSATHNADAGEVILGRYIPNSLASYEVVANSRGSTYFSLGNWGDVSTEIGGDQMWTINRSFLDQQIGQGKSFLFTNDPIASPANSYTRMEYNYLISKGYNIISDKGGMSRATK